MTLSKRAWGIGCAWIGASLALPAYAEVTQPNGTTIPRDSGSEVQLDELFSERGEAIDWIADGFPTPDTFSPLCNFRATFVLNQAGNKLGVGWYNVVPNATTAPTLDEIHEIVPANSPVDTVVEGTSIRNDPAYAGGLIGFALMRSPPHFTEAKWNTKCTGTDCVNAGRSGEPWILSIAYRSTQVPNAYYIAFEDGNTTADANSNDNDYNDDVFLFEGLACAGDGQPCEVPNALGVCKDGISECNNTGELVCKPVMNASEETCDSLDNDCDGETDEGDALCGLDKVCSRGVCVPRCGAGEFECLDEPFTECADGICIDPRCRGVECAAGQICAAGVCHAACDGVACPVGRICRLGACVDPCAGVVCEEPRVCSEGACVLGCSCNGCEAGASCQEATGLCLDDDCVGVSCEAGQYCSASGSCADSCENAECPAGLTCEVGECVPAPISDAGVGGGDPTDGGAGSGGGGAADGGGGDGDAPIIVGPDAGEAKARKAIGCSCRVAGGDGVPSALQGLLALSLSLGLAWRRRRRRPASPISSAQP